MHNSTETDLDWLAFRYISGEMAVSEADQFESLLSDDQGARDAVVRAVELSQAIVAAQPSDQTSGQPPSIGLLSAVSSGWMKQLTWISTSVAALLVIALALNFGSRPSRPADSDDLAEAWVQFERSPEPEEAGSENNSTAEAEFVTTDTPAWMLEAVRSLHGDGTPEADDLGDDEMES